MLGVPELGGLNQSGKKGPERTGLRAAEATGKENFSQPGKNVTRTMANGF